MVNVVASEGDWTVAGADGYSFDLPPGAVPLPTSGPLVLQWADPATALLISTYRRASAFDARHRLEAAAGRVRLHYEEQGDVEVVRSEGQVGELGSQVETLIVGPDRSTTTSVAVFDLGEEIGILEVVYPTVYESVLAAVASRVVGSVRRR